MKILITDGIEKTGADILLREGFELTQESLNAPVREEETLPA
jgi:hypothetical protein